MARAGLIALSFTCGLSATSVLADPGAPAAPQPVATAAAIIITPAAAAAAATEATPAAPVTAVAPTPPAPPAITLTAKVDLTSQRVTVLEHGKPKHTWAISSGAQGFETPTGTFKPGWMAKMWFSKQYDNAPMPHAVFFNGGIAMHATQSTGSLGRPASHGCVRLAPANAAIFYALVSKHGLVHTRIAVTGSPKFAPAAVASRRSQPVYPGVAAYGGYGYASGYNSGYNGGYSGYGYSNRNASAFYQPVPYRPIRYVQIRNRY
jgi:lipoprotein-anchoring transpeptidase ErfK/SrfK